MATLLSTKGKKQDRARFLSDASLDLFEETIEIGYMKTARWIVIGLLVAAPLCDAFAHVDMDVDAALSVGTDSRDSSRDAAVGSFRVTTPALMRRVPPVVSTWRQQAYANAVMDPGILILPEDDIAGWMIVFVPEAEVDPDIILPPASPKDTSGVLRPHPGKVSLSPIQAIRTDEGSGKRDP